MKKMNKTEREVNGEMKTQFINGLENMEKKFF
jgi:hypothetical protein